MGNVTNATKDKKEQARKDLAANLRANLRRRKQVNKNGAQEEKKTK